MGADRRDALAARRAAHRAAAGERRKREGWRAVALAANGTLHSSLERRRAAGRFELLVTPGSVAVKAHNYAPRRALGNARGVVKGWTPKSKRRCILRAASIAWPAVPYVFLTLTYPDAFPHDRRCGSAICTNSKGVGASSRCAARALGPRVSAPRRAALPHGPGRAGDAAAAAAPLVRAHVAPDRHELRRRS
jgi:hypothetical protein